MDAYSQLKPAWHLEQLDSLRSGHAPDPVHVQLILSDLCNQDCGFCAYRMSDGLSTELFGTEATHNPNRQIATEKAIEIIDDCSALHVKAIQFTGGGEPTVHRDHEAIFAHAQKLAIETALVTNGVKLNPRSESILSMQWIRVSVDAGTPATYAKIRRVSEAHWARVWKNVEELALGYAGTLGIGFVVTPDNYLEIGEAARMAANWGASNIRIGAVFSSAGIGFYKDLIDPIIEQIGLAKDEHDSADFEVVDLFGRRLHDLESGSPEEAFCGYQYFTIYIGGDLNVYRCCNTAYTTAGKIGNLSEARLRDVMLKREPFDARQCRFCQFRGQNEAIAALLEEPTHANFV